MTLKVTSTTKRWYLLKLCHMRHSLIIFLFQRKAMFRSQDIQIFCILNDLMIYQICDVMMSISTWDRLHFWIYLLKYNSLSHQTWPVDRYKQGQCSSWIFWTIWRTGARFQVLFNLATSSIYSKKLCQDSNVPFFLKGE